MNENSNTVSAVLKSFMEQNSFTPESLFFRYTSSQYLEETNDGIIYLSAIKNPTEMIIDAYHGGHSLMAKNVGMGLTFTTSVEDDYKSADKKCIEVKLKDILDQNGLIYKVTSVPEYIQAFFFTLPNEKIKVKICEI